MGVQGGPDYSWVAHFLKGEHDVLWPSEPITSASPSLLTGLTMDVSEHLIDNLMEREGKFESADLERHKQFLQEARLPLCDSPLEATAWGKMALSQKRRAFLLTNWSAEFKEANHHWHIWFRDQDNRLLAGNAGRWIADLLLEICSLVKTS